MNSFLFENNLAASSAIGFQMAENQDRNWVCHEEQLNF